jgi:hypothetical protein
LLVALARGQAQRAAKHLFLSAAQSSMVASSDNEELAEDEASDEENDFAFSVPPRLQFKTARR